jgi:hypothetical protein
MGGNKGMFDTVKDVMNASGIGSRLGITPPIGGGSRSTGSHGLGYANIDHS